MPTQRAASKPTVVKKSWNGSNIYDEITVEVKGEVLATVIVFKHGSDVAKFVATIQKLLEKV